MNGVLKNNRYKKFDGMNNVSCRFKFNTYLISNWHLSMKLLKRWFILRKKYIYISLFECSLISELTFGMEAQRTCDPLAHIAKRNICCSRSANRRSTCFHWTQHLGAGAALLTQMHTSRAVRRPVIRNDCHSLRPNL